MNLPTRITVSRIVFVVLLFVYLIVMEYAYPEPMMLGDSGINLTYLIGAVVFLFASATDWLDGYLARKRNEVTDLGKFLDPIADKLLVDAMLVYLCIPRYGNVTIPVACTILMIARDLVIDALRQIAATKGKVLAATYFGKVKTVLQMVSIILVLLNGWPFSYFDAEWPESLRITSWIIYLTTLVSVASMIDYLRKNRLVFSKSDVGERK